jgi:hypothetical protein
MVNVITREERIRNNVLVIDHNYLSSARKRGSGGWPRHLVTYWILKVVVHGVFLQQSTIFSVVQDSLILVSVMFFSRTGTQLISKHQTGKILKVRYRALVGPGLCGKGTPLVVTNHT